jgi:hypothetical protein
MNPNSVCRSRLRRKPVTSLTFRSRKVGVLDFIMGYESYLRNKRPTGNMVIRYVSFVYLYVFEFEGSRRFQFSFTDFSLVYRSAKTQICPRSQPMREFNTSTMDESLTSISEKHMPSPFSTYNSLKVNSIRFPKFTDIFHEKSP